MPRGKKKAADGSQAGGNGRTSTGRVNKAECVRQALATLGYDAKPKEIQEFLDKTYNLKMNTKMISTYKGTASKNAARQSALVRSPAARPTAAARPATGGGLGVEDVRAVKELADNLGADKVRELLDVLY